MELLAQIDELNPKALIQLEFGWQFNGSNLAFILSKKKENEPFHSRIVKITMTWGSGVHNDYKERGLRFVALALMGFKSLQNMTINYGSYNYERAAVVIPRLKNMLQAKNSNSISSPWAISWTQGRDGGKRQLKINANRSGEHSDDSDPEAAFKTFLDEIKKYH